MDPHYFKFSRNWQGRDRLCGECSLTYDGGAHVEVNRLKPYTSYVCPSGGGSGHTSVWTGAYSDRTLRTPRDHLCACGLEFVEEDSESWLLTFETRTPERPEWHSVCVTRSKHAAHQQLEGLFALIDQGEPIRNITLEVA